MPMNDQATIKRMRSKLPGGLLVVVLLVLLSLLVYQLWLSYRDQVRTAEISTRNLAEIFETRLDATLRRTDADLKALAIDIPFAALNQEAVLQYEQEVSVSLDSRLFRLEEMAGYGVHDANGDALYSSDRAYALRVNVAERSDFKLLRDDPGAGLVFSEVFTGSGGGRQRLVIARALRDERGKFMGIVHGLLELEYYRKQFQALNLGAQGLIALRRSDNHAQVVRWPDVPGDLNKSLPPEHPLVKRMANGDKALTLRFATSPENITRIVSVRRMQNYPFYFAVGLGRDEVLAGWRTQVMVIGISTLLLFGLVGALLFRLGRMRVREAGILNNLAKSELQFSGLAQIVPVGICHFDGGGKCTYVNDRHVELVGRSRAELLNSVWADYVHPDDRAKIQKVWDRAGQTGGVFSCEYRLVRPDGRLTHVIGEFQAATDAQGKVLDCIVAQTDITLRKQSEAELLVAKQQAEIENMDKTRLLTTASHDLRQPIQAINLFSDALDRTELSEEQKSISKFISMSVHSLGELIYSLLDISKLDAGLIKPQMKEMPVEELFKAVDAEFSTMARQKNLRFKLFYPFKSMVLRTDYGLLLSILRNLIDNAFKYTRKGGVLVGARKRGGGAVIQVWDTGIGIEPEYANKVFEECFQIGNVLRDRTKGLGIGLSIARRMARLLDGDVSFRSRPGRGTVFELRLPLIEGRAVAEHVLPESHRSHRETADALNTDEEDFSCLRGWQVVVIEDDIMVATSIELLLETMDIGVKVFASAELALTSTHVMGANFYISDLCLPGMNGVKLLDAIQRRSATPINAVLLTGETSPERIANAMSSRWRVLFKPAELSKLLAIMKHPEHAARS